MITNITLENFKCFRHVELNPKRLTVLIGPNGTGKSSVLQALLLLKQSVGEYQIRHQGEFVNLKNSDELAPNLGESSLVRLSVEGEAGGEPFYYSESFYADSLRTVPSDNDEFGEILERLLRLLRFVPAVRGLVRSTYALGSNYVEHISLQQGLGSYESQLATNLGYSRPIEEFLSKLLKRVTGTGLRTEIVPPQSVEVKSLSPSGPVNIVAEGFGANALIQLLHQLIAAEKGATVLIEEPEIHLHPKAQAELAEVLTETAKDEDKQIIMTTHSEYVAGRLLTLVAEGKLTTDELAIYSFLKGEKGECTATEIEVTERGQTKGGLHSFDEATRDEMRRYADGLRKHV